MCPLLLALLLMQAVADEAIRPLLDFAEPLAAQRWQTVNDGVMGGVSDGRFRISQDKMLEFSGQLSPENNGGFASVHTKPMDLDITTKPGAFQMQVERVKVVRAEE